jgi:cytochrome c oxidase cbb3-type subunit 3
MRPLLFTVVFVAFACAQEQPTHQPIKQRRPVEDMAAVQRGQAQFKSTCGFCHGNDAKGSRAPDLTRSAVVSHDDHGSTIGPVVRQGIVEGGMPAFPNLTESQLSDIVAFLHHQMLAAQSSNGVPSGYPLAKLLTGNAEAGKAYFNGAGGCSQCHSPTGDLAGIADKYTPIDLQQHMVYPGAKAATKTATVTLKDGTKYEGKVEHEDAFNIGIICQDGWYRSWPLDQVTVEVHDPLQAHRDLMMKYTDQDIHNLFAYLETLKK